MVTPYRANGPGRIMERKMPNDGVNEVRLVVRLRGVRGVPIVGEPAVSERLKVTPHGVRDHHADLAPQRVGVTLPKSEMVLLHSEVNGYVIPIEVWPRGTCRVVRLVEAARVDAPTHEFSLHELDDCPKVDGAHVALTEKMLRPAPLGRIVLLCQFAVENAPYRRASPRDKL